MLDGTIPRDISHVGKSPYPSDPVVGGKRDSISFNARPSEVGGK